MSSLDDISERSDNDSVIFSFNSTSDVPLRSGLYIITTVGGMPLGRDTKGGMDAALVVTLPKHQPAPKWHIERRDSGHYTVHMDNKSAYFEQIALRLARENELGYEWVIQPQEGKNGVYSIKNASVGAYLGWEDFWIAPKIQDEDDEGLSAYKQASPCYDFILFGDSD
ncbi:hypothetical protein EW026_g6958 [Hermanssonia centrifuga]|uniref:Uncharacterized protein n=1 Tax=Hermanssonia centrifuga TaxID=98765 RepID=A0A4V3X9K5_9APHY|nr:hypothetical protein EW026_g6958 [Hermanssonia centrifuga]